MNPKEQREARAKQFRENLRDKVGTNDKLFVQFMGSGSSNWAEITKESIQYLRDFIDKYEQRNLNNR